MSTHTPGPWSIDGPFTSITAGTVHIADAYHAMYDLPSHPLTLEQGQANARLIAAAPEMLEALQALCSRADPLALDWVKARTAIAKATEESTRAQWGDPTLTEDQAAEMLRKETRETDMSKLGREILKDERSAATRDKAVDKLDWANTRREYVTGFCMIARFYSQPTIILSISGPYGGTKCSEVMSIEQARELRDKLSNALHALENQGD